MAEFVDAATTLDKVPPGTATTVTIAGKDVAIFNVDGVVYAIGDACAHEGASLGAGKVGGKIVTCRAHGLRYDVTTGQVTTGGFGVASYPAKVVDGRILIAVE
jgi:3-phenylpropionate/trans-cinnamate dioxygenase ferredoxin component